MLRRLYYRLSPTGRRFARRLYFLPYDTIGLLFYKQTYLIPPKGKTNVGRGDFKLIGEKFCENIIRECDVSPNMRVLDVGCGIGRIARPFSEYLNKSGKYYGFDILKADIEWCKKRYSEFKNFSFDTFSVKNDLYQPKAKQEASDFLFPYESESFDLVVLVSVFTHMQLNAVENYFDQISKVLKPGGKVYASFFLTEKSKIYNLFPHSYDNYCLHNAKVKNANVAFDRQYTINLAKKHNLEIISEHKGWWSNENIKECFDFQDILVFKKL